MASFVSRARQSHRERTYPCVSSGGLSAWRIVQVVDAAISESVFNMLEGCVPEYTEQGYNRPPSGSTISGVYAKGSMHLLVKLAQ